ncbi:FlgB family protein [Paracoccus denitrificans]|uniref:FlgB family protein n=1 Tax=Paracoccus denitrificans TaxID=266 RepID=UPI000CEC2064|nr:FlgB family protein [Paracoccus denitrificans]
MLDRIDTLRMASSLTAHAVERQKLIARNVANADTPGFRSRDLAGFAETYRSHGPTVMRASRPGHLTEGRGGDGAGHITDAGGEPAPNGNTVSLEEEVFRSAAAKRQFDLSLAVTKSSLSLVRTSLGRRS